MEPELYAASISKINGFIARLRKLENNKISSSNVKVEKIEKNKDELVELAKSLEIVFYRGRFRMKTEDATKDNLMNKILTEKKNKPLENPRDAISINENEVLAIFGDNSAI